MPYIVSTMTADVKYTRWKSNPGGINVAQDSVLIKGGHGVAQKGADGGLRTPEGVLTKVSDDDLKFLMSDEVFQTHLKHGAVKVLKVKAEPAKVAKDMQAGKDAPLQAKDLDEGGRAAVPDSMKVNGGKALQ